MQVIIEKPKDWPINNREANLDVIYELVCNFIKNPNYITKESLFAFLDKTDINEINELGEVRICDYEVAVLNELYYLAKHISCNSLVSYLYGHIGRFIRLRKMFGGMQLLIGEEYTWNIKEYSGLIPPLKLYYICVSDFYYTNKKSFSDTIIHIVKKTFNPINIDGKQHLCESFNQMLFDLSFATSKNISLGANFDRIELQKLFELSAYLNNNVGNKINIRPLKGILKLTIRQWILRSRDYNSESLIYKSISIENTKKVLSNHQVWMGTTNILNDKREQKIIKELFNRKTWIKYDWAKKASIHQLDDCFVCSFSKSKPSSKMAKRYGSNVLGYKTDRIANLLSPIIKGKYPQFDQVLYFDILYDRDEAQNEINYLCEIIDKYELSDKDKTEFFNEILEYWYFTFKDKKWEYEKERRYQLFVFDYKDYFDLIIEDNFLKIKSDLYLYPDFILSKNGNIKRSYKINREQKLKNISLKNYLFCNNCYQADYSANHFDTIDYKICPICGSDDLVYIEV